MMKIVTPPTLFTVCVVVLSGDGLEPSQHQSSAGSQQLHTLKACGFTPPSHHCGFKSQLFIGSRRRSVTLQEHAVNYHQI